MNVDLKNLLIMPSTIIHIPVLASEVIALLQPREGERVLDLTLGLGGHAKAFLENIGPTGHLMGLDADRENLAVAEKILEPWKRQLTLINANFRTLAALDLQPFDIIFADLGLSSPHIDDPARGFTFRDDSPLDMRYDRSHGTTAAQLMGAADEKTLLTVFARYGEVPRAKALARRIWEARHKEQSALTTTGELRRLVEEMYHYRSNAVLPQIFQALRIWVNDELGALQALLAEAPSLIKPGGRLGIISYHSLEDRMVKNAFKVLTTPVIDEQTGQIAQEAPFALLTKKAIKPSEAEIAENPRSRSAVFRALVRRM